MVLKRCPLIFLFAFYLSNHAVCQTPAIRGKIIDNVTGDAIPFATLRAKDNSKGVISNTAGDFQLPGIVASDTFFVSCIGYATSTVLPGQLKRDAINELRLVPVTNSLSEITVTATGRRWGRKADDKSEKDYPGFRIVELALNKISSNFPVKPYSYVAYYRDYQVKSGEYLNLNEAIVEVYDKGFQTNDQLATRIGLYEYRENSEFERDTELASAYDNRPSTYDYRKNKYIPNATISALGGNELSILRVHDAIRNNDVVSYSFFGKLKENFLQNHFFKRLEDVVVNDVVLYCVSFESQISAAGTLNFAKGKIYIEKKNFAIHKLQYACYNKTMREVQLMYDIQVEYSRIGPLMYLNYISFNNFFKTRNDVNFKVIKMRYDQDTNALVIDFNIPPERLTALNKEN